MLKTFKLANGLQIASYNLPDLKSVHLRICAKGGAVVEDKEISGIAHFMEHLLVQGIPSLPNVEDFSGFIESMAGSYGAHTERLLVCFNITLPAVYLEDAVKIASEVFFEPLFMETAIEKERGAIKEEITQKMDSHWYKISEFYRQIRFDAGNPLVLDVGGRLEVVAKLKRQDLVKFWQKYFLPHNTHIVVSGKFVDASLRKLLERYFLKYQSPKSFPGFPKISNQDLSSRQVAIRSDSKLKVNYIDLTFPSLSLDEDLKTRIKQNLALVILGGLRNSRLFKLLRYQKGLVYNVDAGSNVLPGLGYVYISSEVSSENLEEVVSLIVLELAAFIKNGPTQEELRFVKNYLSNQWLMTFDHPSAISGWIENDLVWNDQVRLPEDYIKMIENITVEDVKAVMDKYWSFGKLNLTIQGPIEASKENIAKFEDLVAELK